MVGEIDRRILLVGLQAHLPVGKGRVKSGVQINLGFLDGLEEIAKLINSALHTHELVHSGLQLPDFAHSLFEGVLHSEQA